MTADTFDASADSAANYAHAMAMFRLQALIRGDRWPVEEDDGAFDLLMAAARARLAA